MAIRVVVTGMGTVNPLGNTVDQFWQGIREGRSGVGPITRFDASQHSTRIAAEVKDFNARDFIDGKEARKMDIFSQYACAAAAQAWSQSGLPQRLPEDGASAPGVPRADRVAVILGVGVGGFETFEESYSTLRERGPGRVPILTVPKLIANIGPANVAMQINAWGPAYSIATACASGTDAIGQGLRMIQSGQCDVVVCGGAEATVTPLGIAGFNVLHALSTHYNDSPQRASRPFDKDRDGFVLGEGAGVLVLESLDHARARGAAVLGEVVGVGATNDAFHMTAPHSEGRGAILAMKAALDMAGIKPEQVDYINAHGTSTEINDATETKAIKAVFGDHAYRLKVSSTKSMTGHLIGAAGAIEAIVCIKALQDQYYPATLNLDNPDRACDLNYVPHQGVEGPMTWAMSNSLGFGGHNGILLFRRWLG